MTEREVSWPLGTSPERGGVGCAGPAAFGLRGGRGVFLALEGPDGGGKSSQVEGLTAWLGRTQNREVVTCRDPGSTELGGHLRRILLDRQEIPLGMTAEMLLYMASRAQLWDEVIGPALERDAIVVSDRYLTSNIVYQGYAGGLDASVLWSVGYVATRGVLPDLTWILDVAPEVARGRIGSVGRDRIEGRSESYRDKVRAGFLAVAAQDPHRIRVIDASQPFETVQAQLQHEVITHALARDPRS